MCKDARLGVAGLAIAFLTIASSTSRLGAG